VVSDLDGELTDIPSPALVVDEAAFEANVATVAAVLPGRRLRPHVKAFKSTELARRLSELGGHEAFCCATPRELEGLLDAGVGDDLLLANEVVGRSAERMGELSRRGEEAGVRVTVAVDSDETIRAAAAAGVRSVLIDVDVGLPRCGCAPTDAGRLADEARRAGLDVRGVMGYEGHLMRAEAGAKEQQVRASMELLLAAREAVGGPIVSAGGTGTYRCNTWANEIQAGSYCLMDTEYAPQAPELRLALFVLGTCISTNGRWAVVDVGLKALGMDHGDPSVEGARCLFVSDEHVTVVPSEAGEPLPEVGERVRVWPAHVDPTVAYHERMYVVRAGEVVDVWPVDLRNW
jgi:D-serine deaminase-like pyridoxal phosphate-dependent protein